MKTCREFGIRLWTWRGNHDLLGDSGATRIRHTETEQQQLKRKENLIATVSRSDPERSRLESMADQGDDMDSLFEGMMLFTPSQFSDHHPLQQQDPVEQRPLSPSPSELNSSVSSEPLDENLFSDLTLVTPMENSYENGHQLSPSTAVEVTEAVSNSRSTREIHSLSRQVSRKKKRASGLRIGYGRQDVEREIISAQVDSVPVETKSQREILSVDSIESRSDSKTEHGEVSFTATVDTDRETPISVELRSDGDAETNSKASSNTTLREEEDICKDDVNSQPEKQNLEEESVLISDRTEQGNGNGVLDEHLKEKDESIEAKFERVKASVADKLEKMRELTVSLSVAKKESIQKRRKAGERVNLSSTKIKELERSLEEACEAEDFEMAESVSESIAAADKERQALVDALRDAEAECDGMDAQMQQVLEAQIAAEEECVSLLENFSMEANTNAELIVEKAKLLYSEEMERWLTSTEALEGRKMEVEIESHVIGEAREVLNSSIEHSTNDDLREKDDLFKKKDKLMSELEELLSLVREKEKEIEENDSKIEAVENRIANVVTCFEETQSTIVENYDRLQSDLSKMELENRTLSLKKVEIDESLSREEEKGNKIKELGKICSNRAKAYHELAELRKSLMLSILKFTENKLGLVKAEGKLSNDVQKLREEASSARSSLQELSSTKSSFQQEIASFEQRILFIDKRLPELESEKKVAAAARNFKEAARIAAEVKSLNTEKDGVQTEQERTTSELSKFEEQIAETIKRLHETEEQILSKEKELAMARIQRLLITAGAAKAERYAALELGDVEEANLLVAEAEAAESEAKRLCPIYEIKEEEIGDMPKDFVSIASAFNLGGKQHVEVSAASNGE